LAAESWMQKAGCRRLNAERLDVEGWSQEAECRKAGCRRLKAEMNRCKSGWRFMM
jgi:hypothetical protein